MPQVEKSERLRVALVAGSLGLGGAEKQLVYMARALVDSGVDVRVYSLTRGEHYEAALKALGIRPVWIGRYSNPFARLVGLARVIAVFKPHILQSTHFFVNLYAAFAARICGALSIGSLRSDLNYAVRRNGRWGRALLQMPVGLIVNSRVACRQAEQFGVRKTTIRILPNVIDLEDYADHTDQGQQDRNLKDGSRIVVAVGNLIRAKRLDRFLVALAAARLERSDIKGIIVGDGPERESLELLAGRLGLLPDGISFAGRRGDVFALLRQAHMLVLTSDNEGFPNVLLEAMAARLPVITTPAGDAAIVVQDGITGYVTNFNDISGIAARILQLAESSEIRTRFGEAGRHRVEINYDFKTLAARLTSIYRDIAEQRNRHSLLAILGQ